MSIVDERTKERSNKLTEDLKERVEQEFEKCASKECDGNCQTIVLTSLADLMVQYSMMAGLDLKEFLENISLTWDGWELVSSPKEVEAGLVN